MEKQTDMQVNNEWQTGRKKHIRYVNTAFFPTYCKHILFTWVYIINWLFIPFHIDKTALQLFKKNGCMVV